MDILLWTHYYDVLFSSTQKPQNMFAHMQLINKYNALHIL